MKNSFLISTGIALLFLLSSCSIHHGLTHNANLNSTEVVLSQNNFTVLSSVQGSSQALFVFGMGGITKKAMIAEARTQMLSKADIYGSSKAIINETVEIHHSFFPIVRFYTVTVSGHVIEFKD